MDDLTTQDSLRDTIANAVEEVEAPQEPVVEATEPETPLDVANDGRPRDEHGRFAKKPEAPPVEVIEQPVVQVKPRPTSWKKDYEEHWGKLDPTLQEYIIQREADYAKGVSTYKNQWDQAAPLMQAMEQFAPLLQQNNVRPDEWIRNLGTAHATLVYGTPEQKLQMFAQLANEYGVSLDGLNGGEVNPQFGHLTQTVTQLQNEIRQFKSLQEQQTNQAVQSEIQRFSADKPHFEAVKETMAQLLQSGVVDNLQSAYDKAIRLHDEIWQQQQAEAQQAKAKAEAEAQQKRVAEAKAKALSPKSSSPTAANSGGKGGDLRSALSEAFDSVAGGHI